MKKLLVILLSGIMAITLVACGTSEKKDEVVKEKQETVQGDVEKEGTKDDEKSKSDVLVTLENIKFTTVDDEPNSIGDIYTKATLTNNSEYPIMSFDATIVRKQDNAKSYLTTFDIVMPGEKSAKFETIVGENGVTEGFEVVHYEYSVVDGDKKHIISYDVKLDKYETSTYDLVTADEKDIIVKYDELELITTDEAPNSIGDIYTKATVTNNSEYPLISFDATIVRKQDNTKSYLTTFDTIMAGETSANFEAIVGEDGVTEGFEIIEYEYSILKDDLKYNIIYSPKLNTYFVETYEN